MSEQTATTGLQSVTPVASVGFNNPFSRWRKSLGGWCLNLWVAAVVAVIYAPIIIVVGASVDPGTLIESRAFLTFPPRGFSLQWYLSIHPRLWQSLWVSLSMASISAACGLLIGVPAALGLIRSDWRGKILMGTLFRAPLQIPFIVIGVAFLQAYHLAAEVFNINFVGSFSGLVLGHVFVAVPYVISAVGVQLQRFNPAMEEAALIHGASRMRTFMRITLPIIMPGIYAGGLYAFLISFGDVTISLFLAGPDTTPFPVQVLHTITQDFDPTVPAMASLVCVGSLFVLLGVQRLVGLDILLRGGGSG
jgi:putative spermidine/putrescine transport system permease protein